MMRFLGAPALAIVVVIGVAAAGSGDADYELVIPGIIGPICAKSETTCNAAREALFAGRWLPTGITIARFNESLPFVDCKPHPSCFSEASNHIQGYR